MWQSWEESRSYNNTYYIYLHQSLHDNHGRGQGHTIIPTAYIFISAVMAIMGEVKVIQ